MQKHDKEDTMLKICGWLFGGIPVLFFALAIITEIQSQTFWSILGTYFVILIAAVGIRALCKHIKTIDEQKKQEWQLVFMLSLFTLIPFLFFWLLNVYLTTNNVPNANKIIAYGLGIYYTVLVIALIAYQIIINVIGRHKNHYSEIVMANSEPIKKLKELNDRTDFKIPDLPESLYEECTSKQRFNNLSTDDFLIYSIRDRLTYYEKAIKIIESNRRKLEEYQQEVNRIIKTVAPLSQEQCRELKVRRLTARKFEDELFSQLLLYPITDINLEVRIEYTTPAGKQSYHKEQVYSFQELQSVFYQAKNIMETEETKRAWIRTERAKMSDSLRYDVLKRDNFCCQICGATAEDGVKLHVDHIIPVSKGGKTEMSNLRTLCERCNLGKSDKM